MTGGSLFGFYFKIRELGFEGRFGRGEVGRDRSDEVDLIVDIYIFG